MHQQHRGWSCTRILGCSEAEMKLPQVGFGPQSPAGSPVCHPKWDPCCQQRGVVLPKDPRVLWSCHHPCPVPPVDFGSCPCLPGEIYSQVRPLLGTFCFLQTTLPTPLAVAAVLSCVFGPLSCVFGPRCSFGRGLAHVQHSSVKQSQTLVKALCSSRGLWVRTEFYKQLQGPAALWWWRRAPFIHGSNVEFVFVDVPLHGMQRGRNFPCGILFLNTRKTFLCWKPSPHTRRGSEGTAGPHHPKAHPSQAFLEQSVSCSR